MWSATQQSKESNDPISSLVVGYSCMIFVHWAAGCRSKYRGVFVQHCDSRGSWVSKMSPNSIWLLSLFTCASQHVGPGHLRQYPPNPAMVMKSIINMNGSNGMISRNQLTTINQSQLNTQLSLNMGGPNITHTSPSPPASKSATPSPSSSINEDDQDDGNRVRKRSWLCGWMVGNNLLI